MISSQDGKPVIECGAKVGLVTDFDVVLDWLNKDMKIIKDIQSIKDTVVEMMHKIDCIHSRSENLIKLVERDYLIAFHWSNAISAASGDSSVIISLPAGEKMNSKKINELQIEILDKISNAGHVNDPDAIVITAVSKLEK